MSARQLCSLVYFFLAEGRDDDELLELDRVLDPANPRVQEHRRAAVLAMGGEIG